MTQTGHNLGPHLVEEEESYFVSMTDMMVGIIFIFVILLMTFALSYREAEEVRQEKVEQLQAVEDAKREILEDIQESLEKVGIKVIIDVQNGILHLPEEILFPSGSARLNVQGRQSLGYLASALAQVIPCYASGSARVTTVSCEGRANAKLDAIFVEGHTDDVPVRSDSPYEDNWDLSAQRAIETYKQLVAIDDSLDELLNDNEEKLFSVSGYGEFRPREANGSDESRQLNRRIDLRFLMKTPRPEDLEVLDDRIQEAVKSK